MINIIISFRIIQNHVMISCILIANRFCSFYGSSFPYYLITEIFFSKNIIQSNFYISTYMPVYMNINAPFFR